jgi:pimeloyl-ACP methyl ester carboxylesterase
MTPRSWEHWVPHYEARGYRVLTPGYPGFHVEVEALRADPRVIAELSLTDTIDSLAAVVTALDRPPIVMGHSFGGTLTQLLLDRGLGAAGVAIDSAPTEGVRVNPPSQIRSLLPFLANPANRRRAVGFTPRAAPVRHRRRGPPHAAICQPLQRPAPPPLDRAHRGPRPPRPLALDLR